MIDPAEGVLNAHVVNQSVKTTKTSIHPQRQSADLDTIQISEAAKSAMNEAAETHHEVTIKAKCGDLEAQRLLEQEAARKNCWGYKQYGSPNETEVRQERVLNRKKHRTSISSGVPNSTGPSCGNLCPGGSSLHGFPRDKQGRFYECLNSSGCLTYQTIQKSSLHPEPPLLHSVREMITVPTLFMDTLLLPSG